MRLTEYTDYSLRVLLYVAVHPDELVTVQCIAETFGIPKNHLTKIVAHLGQLGFLTTVRGRCGGIALGMAPQKINLGKVVRATEPDFRLVECFASEGNRCIITGACGLRHVLASALAAYLAVLDSYTLKDLVKRPEALQRALSGASILPARIEKRAPQTH
ncbi:HTH-type transcriptional regulator NsrR [Cupriavidus sp. TA19]|uniref:RrF2 family transcriptional regulator n=1 Tax=unclassified Cupriavidus TaxID=2640874 RepID=UPI000E2E61D4|nr:MULTISPECIES: Rrf2 family transcriptional regulator [unclassified Cupriavidus]BDB29694.1 Rrf2 family transcriptional regulator [Cupriavidus sp. P-10]GLC94383.1 HTH-type transcriptional regulator NsrR [Cupriavidus sp. TA19]